MDVVSIIVAFNFALSSISESDGLIGADTTPSTPLGSSRTAHGDGYRSPW